MPGGIEVACERRASEDACATQEALSVGPLPGVSSLEGAQLRANRVRIRCTSKSDHRVRVKIDLQEAHAT
jgi:hypothetical protein